MVEITYQSDIQMGQLTLVSALQFAWTEPLTVFGVRLVLNRPF